MTRSAAEPGASAEPAHPRLRRRLIPVFCSNATHAPCWLSNTPVTRVHPGHGQFETSTANDDQLGRCSGVACASLRRPDTRWRAVTNLNGLSKFAPKCSRISLLTTMGQVCVFSIGRGVCPRRLRDVGLGCE